jgi:ceroid-lipofuscinosis MFS transporter 7
MDPKAGTDFLGLFIAAQPLAQLIFSPLMGYLGNKLGSIRILSMISMSFLAGGFALYACVAALPEPRRWYLFAARFLIGAAGGSITLCFSYIATATTIKERTMAVSLFQMAQSSAFVVCPGNFFNISLLNLKTKQI